MEVNPTRSQNITVTCFRSPSMRSFWERIFWVSPSGRYRWILSIFSSNVERSSAGVEELVRLAPHSMQNLLPVGFFVLHSGHVNSILLPHSLQNLALSGTSLLHFEHFIDRLLSENRRDLNLVFVDKNLSPKVQ